MNRLKPLVGCVESAKTHRRRVTQTVPTLTVALLPGSPAIDAGDNTGAPEWDQRGPEFPRIVNGTIDIGAFEVQASPIPAPGPGFDLLAAVLATADFDSLT